MMQHEKWTEFCLISTSFWNETLQVVEIFEIVLFFFYSND